MILMVGRTAGKIDRLIKLLYYLSLKTPGGGATLEELAEKCGVSERQVYRDIDVLDSSDSVKLNRPRKGMKSPGRYCLQEAFPLKIGPEAAALSKNRYGDRNDELEQLHNRT